MVSRLPAGTAPSALRAAANGAVLPASEAAAPLAGPVGPAAARAAGPPAATAIVVAATAVAAAMTVLDFFMVSLSSRRCKG